MNKFYINSHNKKNHKHTLSLQKKLKLKMYENRENEKEKERELPQDILKFKTKKNIKYYIYSRQFSYLI